MASLACPASAMVQQSPTIPTQEEGEEDEEEVVEWISSEGNSEGGREKNETASLKRASERRWPLGSLEEMRFGN